MLQSVLVAFVAALVLIVLLSLAVMVYQMSYWRRRGIAHRRPDFFYGNLRGVMESKHFADCFREAYDCFKGTGLFAGFYMLFDATALILDLDLIKHILIRDFPNFSERGFFYNERDDPLTAHIFSLPTEEWRQLRTKLSPAFTGGKLKQMFPGVLATGQRLVVAIDAALADGSGGRREAATLELKDFYDRFTTDVIGTCIFGLECNSLQDPSTEFRAMNQNLFDNPRNHRAIDGLLYAFPRLARLLRLKQIPDATSDFYFRIVLETMRYRKEHGVQRNDLMDMLLQLKQRGALTLDDIVANAFLFFFAGFETSSTTMTLALYELARHQACQERVRAELNEALEASDGVLTYECSLSLPYLDQVINETLRLHTIIPHLQRKTLHDYATADAKFHIAKGTLVLIPVDAIHHDPDIYEAPQEFRPERFEPAEVRKRHPMAWLPFGEGPRNCIGTAMGRMQMRIGLAALLQRFRFEVVERTPARLDYYLQCPLLVPKSDIFLGVRRI